MDKLINAVKENFGILSGEEMEFLTSFFQKEVINKNDYFTRENGYCKKLSFQESGILRIYKNTDKGAVTQWLSTPGNFMTEINSFFFDQPSRWSIQALSDVTLFTLHLSDYKILCKELPKWNAIEKNFIASCFRDLEDRVFSHLYMTAKERYDSYFKRYPELFNQVPLQYIASVIGMSPETLSRIRKQNLLNS